jgi:hypothetical protein
MGVGVRERVGVVTSTGITMRRAVGRVDECEPVRTCTRYHVMCCVTSSCSVV